MLKNRSFYIVLLTIGICCIGISIIFNDAMMKPVVGSLLGIGAGLIGMSLANLVMKQLELNNPALEKQSQIDFHDERNTMIRNRAKAKAGDITQWLIMAIAYITILISAPLWVTLAVVIVFLIYHFIGIYLINKYQKEM
ncbi:hypothetical protein [Acetobacterium bakii]|uniref:DUF2178 domain-containing protein n=1 Tax=Acetobacterium bakii TaxID=52689 RepID=A0A0L6TYF2_9FIRM|nr:hypothetical protein [Acetobacterium bakii]KNZ41299.1 hypothetical protein AKG39_13415 [Acetobacterium bakii]